MNSQPTCAGCGVQEITYVHAAARGWKRALEALRCPSCARRLPVWMLGRI